MNEFEFENPFQKLGLAPEFVKSLVEINDDEAMMTALVGLKRVMSKALHSDRTGGAEENSFFIDMLTASSELETMTAPDVRTMAQEFTRKGRAKRRTATVPEKVVEYLEVPKGGKRIIEDLANAKFLELGLTMKPQSRIFVRHDFSPFYEEQEMLGFTLFHMPSANTLTLNRYQLSEIEDREKRKKTHLEVNSHMNGLLDWDLLCTPQQQIMMNDELSESRKRLRQYRTARQSREIEKHDAKSLSGLIEVQDDGSAFVFNAIGEFGQKISSDEMKLVPTMGPSTNHTFVLSRSVDEQNTTVHTYTYNLKNDAEQDVWRPARVLGSVGIEFQRTLRKKNAKYTHRGPKMKFDKNDPFSSGSSEPHIPNASLPAGNTGLNNGLFVDPEELDLAASWFTPRITEGDSLLVSTERGIRIVGTILHFYHHPVKSDNK